MTSIVKYVILTTVLTTVIEETIIPELSSITNKIGKILQKR